MKKTILILFVLFSSFLSAQTETLLLEGEWESSDTSYNCIITVGDHNELDRVKTIHNVSYKENMVLVEKIKFQDRYKVITTHTNKVNGHTVESTYVLNGPNTLHRRFRGDSNMMIFYTRVKNN
jgi:hypothetical protein